jgi:hypothetical protein
MVSFFIISSFFQEIHSILGAIDSVMIYNFHNERWDQT